MYSMMLIMVGGVAIPASMWRDDRSPGLSPPTATLRGLYVVWVWVARRERHHEHQPRSGARPAPPPRQPARAQPRGLRQPRSSDARVEVPVPRIIFDAGPEAVGRIGARIARGLRSLLRGSRATRDGGRRR